MGKTTDWGSRPVPMDDDDPTTDWMDDAEIEIYRLQATITEHEEWTILRCNELGDQIKKRDKRIESQQATIEASHMAMNKQAVRIKELQATITELRAEIAEWRAATSVPNWRELKYKIKASKEKT